MNNYNNRYNEQRDYYQKTPHQDRRYQNPPYRSQSSGYNQHYNNSYEPYSPPNRYDSYPQRYQSYSPGYESYQQPQQYPYNPNMYNQGSPSPQPPYQYGPPYNNQQYSNMPPGDLGQSQPVQVQNDQDYMNSKLIDFRGRLHEYIPFASPRRAIVSLYTGAQSDDWLINELIQNMTNFIEYKAGVTFLYNIQNKMTYKSPKLSEAIANNYVSILKIPDGYKLFSNIAEDVSTELLTNIAKWCFDLYPQYNSNDPDFINLLSVFVKVQWNNPNCYLKMINLSVYLSNPTASVIGCSIVKHCSDNVVGNFLNEINNNLSTLINDNNLVELVNSLLIRGPKNVRDLLFSSFYNQIDSFIAHQWKWKICSTLLFTLSLSQKFQLAEKICKNCANVKEKHMDELICQALNVVTAYFRINSLLSLLSPILDNVEFPLSNDFIKNIKYADSVVD